MTRSPTTISSLQNDRIKAIRALEMRKERRERGLFVAEGASILVTARERGWTPRTLVLIPDAGGGIHRGLAASALAAGADVLEVTHAVMAKLAAKDNPQTMMGVFEQRWAEPPAARDLGAGDVWLALEEVRDPGNLGSIVRTVEATGARGVILIGNCCDPYARECVRATMGSIFAVPLVRMSRDAFLAWRVGWTGDVVGTDLAAGLDFRAPGTREPVLLVMGSEGPGLSDALRAACTRLVVIPMAGGIDSLNLAVATALALYQLRGTYLALGASGHG